MPHQASGGPPLPLTQIASSDLEAVGYDQTLEILDVKFRKGGTKRYFNVGAPIYSGLLAAKSKGQYFAANIRNHYQHVDL